MSWSVKVLVLTVSGSSGLLNPAVTLTSGLTPEVPIPGETDVTIGPKGLGVSRGPTSQRSHPRPTEPPTCTWFHCMPTSPKPPSLYCVSWMRPRLLLASGRTDGVGEAATAVPFGAAAVPFEAAAGEAPATPMLGRTNWLLWIPRSPPM